ncbi:hypothetical protein DFH06DRAFT_1205124 [Mycena polygramma]|nr:hypothetical protein DFH06DRAFT_1205124 [Mycena polygramma]
MSDAMQMSVSELAAVGVFCSYFSIIAGLFFLIWNSLPSSGPSLGRRAYVFIALTLASFAHTWFCGWIFTARTTVLRRT